MELSLHALDLLRNSAKAGARRVVLYVLDDSRSAFLELCVRDDGAGMDEESLSAAGDPFYGGPGAHLGLPLLADAAKMCGGRLRVKSAPGRGTAVRASFLRSHPDLPPMGDLAGTLAVARTLYPGVSFALRCGATAEELDEVFNGFDTPLEDECLR